MQPQCMLQPAATVLLSPSVSLDDLQTLEASLRDLCDAGTDESAPSIGTYLSSLCASDLEQLLLSLCITDPQRFNIILRILCLLLSQCDKVPADVLQHCVSCIVPTFVLVTVVTTGTSGIDVDASVNLVTILLNSYALSSIFGEAVKSLGQVFMTRIFNRALANPSAGMVIAFQPIACFLHLLVGSGSLPCTEGLSTLRRLYDRQADTYKLTHTHPAPPVGNVLSVLGAELSADTRIAFYMSIASLALSLGKDGESISKVGRQNIRYMFSRLCEVLSSKLGTSDEHILTSLIDLVSEAYAEGHTSVHELFHLLSADGAGLLCDGASGPSCYGNLRTVFGTFLLALVIHEEGSAGMVFPRTAYAAESSVSRLFTVVADMCPSDVSSYVLLVRETLRCIRGYLLHKKVDTSLCFLKRLIQLAISLLITPEDSYNAMLASSPSGLLEVSAAVFWAATTNALAVQKALGVALADNTAEQVLRRMRAIPWEDSSSLVICYSIIASGLEDSRNSVFSRRSSARVSQEALETLTYLESREDCCNGSKASTVET